ncbi:hypothetical protein SXM_3864 [Shewanella xiamenensis]|nr:hypothetical protein SXM_3864 [Shewanella xiamenensis]
MIGRAKVHSVIDLKWMTIFCCDLLLIANVQLTNIVNRLIYNQAIQNILNRFARLLRRSKHDIKI